MILLIEQDVFWLDVAVCDAASLHVFQHADDFHRVELRQRIWERFYWMRF